MVPDLDLSTAGMKLRKSYAGFFIGEASFFTQLNLQNYSMSLFSRAILEKVSSF